MTPNFPVNRLEDTEHCDLNRNMNYPYHHCQGMCRQVHTIHLFLSYFTWIVAPHGGTGDGRGQQDILLPPKWVLVRCCSVPEAKLTHSSSCTVLLTSLFHLLNHCCSTSALRRQKFSTTQRQLQGADGCSRTNAVWIEHQRDQQVSAEFQKE